MIEINPSATANQDNTDNSASQTSSNTAATTVPANSTKATTPATTAPAESTTNTAAPAESTTDTNAAVDNVVLVSVTTLGLQNFANYISAPNAVIKKPLLGVAYDGKTIEIPLGGQVFFKVNIDPKTGQTLFVDESVINGGFTYLSGYNSFADINPYLPNPIEGEGGVRLYSLTAGEKVGKYTFRLLMAQSPTFKGDWEDF